MCWVNSLSSKRCEIVLIKNKVWNLSLTNSTIPHLWTINGVRRLVKFICAELLVDESLLRSIDLSARCSTCPSFCNPYLWKIKTYSKCKTMKVDYGSSIDRWAIMYVRHFQLRDMWIAYWNFFPHYPTREPIDGPSIVFVNQYCNSLLGCGLCFKDIFSLFLLV